INGRVFRAMRYLLRQRLELRRPVTYIDATNLTPRERRAWIRMGELHGCTVEALFFDVPLATCQERNRLRSRMVPEEALLHLAAKLVPPTLEEGFTCITVVRE
ncbi:MAG TPA: AAA family ATPase, partial [Bryobacteraceae bacterium]